MEGPIGDLLWRRVLEWDHAAKDVSGASCGPTQAAAIRIVKKGSVEVASAVVRNTTDPVVLDVACRNSRKAVIEVAVANRHTASKSLVEAIRRARKRDQMDLFSDALRAPNLEFDELVELSGDLTSNQLKLGFNGMVVTDADLEGLLEAYRSRHEGMDLAEGQICTPNPYVLKSDGSVCTCTVRRLLFAAVEWQLRSKRRTMSELVRMGVDVDVIGAAGIQASPEMWVALNAAITCVADAQVFLDVEAEYISSRELEPESALVRRIGRVPDVLATVAYKVRNEEASAFRVGHALLIPAEAADLLAQSDSPLCWLVAAYRGRDALSAASLKQLLSGLTGLIRELQEEDRAEWIANGAGPNSDDTGLNVDMLRGRHVRRTGIFRLCELLSVVGTIFNHRLDREDLKAIAAAADGHNVSWSNVLNPEAVSFDEDLVFSLLDSSGSSGMIDVLTSRRYCTKGSLAAFARINDTRGARKRINSTRDTREPTLEYKWLRNYKTFPSIYLDEDDLTEALVEIQGAHPGLIGDEQIHGASREAIGLNLADRGPFMMGVFAVDQREIVEMCGTKVLHNAFYGGGHSSYLKYLVSRLYEAVGDDAASWERATALLGEWDGTLGQLMRSLRRELKLRGGVLPDTPTAEAADQGNLLADVA
ncbi:MAG: hypothetical protein GY901_10565 [Actinomycetia bacterium]|nr:hypothetical protein [Actinomycetes bacterium]